MGGDRHRNVGLGGRQSKRLLNYARSRIPELLGVTRFEYLTSPFQLRARTCGRGSRGAERNSVRSAYHGGYGGGRGAFGEHFSHR